MQLDRAEGKSLEAQKINQKLDNIRTQIGKQYQSICDRDNFVSAGKSKTLIWVSAMITEPFIHCRRIL